MLNVSLWVRGQQGESFFRYTFSYFLNVPQGGCIIFIIRPNSIYKVFHFIPYWLILYRKGRIRRRGIRESVGGRGESSVPLVFIEHLLCAGTV